MIELRHINKSFGSVDVLRDVNLEIRDHEIMAIVGPSGAGKTTLLQIAGTLDRPDSGKVLYDGTEITGLTDRRLSAFRNANIGFVFQLHRLLPEFTALENVSLPALIGGQSRKEASRSATELLDMLGLSHRISHKPQELSGGECQRVALARALINKPAVIFADEPTGSLDSANREEIHALFARLRDTLGQTFVIVTHDSSLAGIADRVVRMSDGRISDESSEEEEIPLA